MILYDITNVDSFEAIAKKWLPEVTLHIPVSCELNRVTDQLNKLSYTVATDVTLILFYSAKYKAAGWHQV